MEELMSIKGTVEKIIFKNENNGYTVLNANVSGEEVTFVGEVPFISVGETIDAIGNWVNHSKFGMQFEIRSYNTYFPTESNVIIKYLSSGIIKGLGEVTAERIVKKFGNDTIEVISNDPQKIYEVDGISRVKAKNIIEEFDKIFGLRALSSKVEKYGISAEESIKIWKSLGKDALNAINENPYVLCSESIGLDFEKADTIAEKLGKNLDDSLRIRSGIIYVLKHNLNNGHTCLPKHKLVPTIAEFLNTNKESVELCIDDMLISEELNQYEIDENLFIFLPHIYSAELYCAERIMMMLKNIRMPNKSIDKKIKQEETVNNIKYASLQKEAILRSTKSNIFILTGGPGTGKTTTLKAIISLLESMGEKVILSAPTGRASQRMQELTGREAKTIHRMLEVGFEDEKPVFHRNERNLLDCDTIVIDEFSMVDILLFEGVLRALPMSSRIIIVGDTNQLPSVGPGNLLSDMIASKLIPMVELNEIFRQSKESLIITNSHKIIRGAMPDLSSKNSDFFFIKNYSQSSVSDIVADLCSRRLPKRYNYSPFKDIQVICPGKAGELGVRALNQKLQDILNPSDNRKNSLVVNGKVFREQDKVMQNKNNYDIYWEKENGESGQGVFNGDIGIILEIDKNQSYMAIKFDDRIAVYDFNDLMDLELAYAITVHKSQGSEFKAVIVPVYGKSKMLNYRNILYTAITRSQDILILIGMESTVKLMVDNNIRIKRYSAFEKMITALDF